MKLTGWRKQATSCIRFLSMRQMRRTRMALFASARPLLLIAGVATLILFAANDYPREKDMDPLVMSNIAFTVKTDSTCNIKSRNLVVILVHSARRHTEYRKRIRQTWGSLSTVAGWEFRKIFLLGIGAAGEVSKSVLQESWQFGDIVLGDFVDSYRNLSLKHLLGYKWVLQHCPYATFIVKTDDDMFINPFNLVKLLRQRQFAYGEKTKIPPSIMCNQGKREPQRVQAEGDKWAVSWEEFPGYLYPNFCLGAAYVTTPKIMRKIFDVHSYVNRFWIDDVFVTGILRTSFNNYNAKKKSEIIGLHNIDSYFALNERHPIWRPDKIFYLLKIETMNFNLMNQFWRLTEAHFQE